MSSRMRRIRSARITSDAYAATKVTLRAIQASTDACAPLKSAVSAVIVVLELIEKVKSNKKECEHIAERTAEVVQDIWRQTKDFNVALPTEVEKSVVKIEKLFKEIEIFFEELKEENVWKRIARQDRNKSQVDEYERLLDEAMLHFNFNMELSMHRLHLESVAADQKRHADVLIISQMSETERLQLLTQIRGNVHMGIILTGAFFFLDPRREGVMRAFPTIVLGRQKGKVAKKKSKKEGMREFQRTSTQTQGSSRESKL
ncbi:hypothetical protein MVEN_01487900 [Mycena venus]|uniref:Uncharacterized protein n=1 Tax=Mycena venus TaxID=2733690 RepID=A0A8H6XV64_9AGAR|nr:hypothetical protein MVEN_01487900 [Mycena venus]